MFDPHAATHLGEARRAQRIEGPATSLDATVLDALQKELLAWTKNPELLGRVPTPGHFHRFCITGSLRPSGRDEPRLDQASAEKLDALKVAWTTKWIQRVGSSDMTDLITVNAPSLQWNSVRNTLAANSGLNEVCGVSLQGGRQDGFIYVDPPLFNPKCVVASGELTEKIYVNCSSVGLAEVLEMLTSDRVCDGRQMSLKFMDLANPRISDLSARRRDRIVVSTTREDRDSFVAELISLGVQKPEWFSDKKLPLFVSLVSPGVGLATHREGLGSRDPKESPTSFAMSRAHFLYMLLSSSVFYRIAHVGDVPLSDGLKPRDLFEGAIQEITQEISDFEGPEAASAYTKEVEQALQSGTPFLEDVLLAPLGIAMLSIVPKLTVEEFGHEVKPFIERWLSIYSIDPVDYSRCASTS